MSKTPPHLKWLLNERAMLAGELARLAERIEKLVALRDQATEKLRALDRTLARADNRVRPDAGGIVRAHTRYGARGALTDFIVLQLEQAAPAFLDTPEITHLCAVRFGFVFESAPEFSEFKHNNVRRALRTLRDAGRIESRRQPGHKAPTLWRLKLPASSLEALASLPAESGDMQRAPGGSRGADDDPHEDPEGPHAPGESRCRRPR